MKTIEVDWDNPSDLKRAIYKLDVRRKTLLKRLGYHEAVLNDQTVHADAALETIDHILNADVSPAYSSSLLSEATDFYVYAQCDPSKVLNPRDVKQFMLATKFGMRYAPFYVGKGRGDRAEYVSRNSFQQKILKQLASKRLTPVVVKLRTNLTELEAFMLEAKLIDILGLRSLSSNGLLANIDEGAHSKLRRAAYPPVCTVFLNKNGFAL